MVRQGAKLNVAKVVILLEGIREATAAEIERRSGLRQSDVSVAMKYLIERGLIRIHKGSSAGTGRPVKIYRLAKPLPEIVDHIRQEKNERMNRQLVRLREPKYTPG
jgi:predicted transcriptional regulator